MGMEESTEVASSMDVKKEKPVGLRALEALGKGFDLSSDFRLKFAKGLTGNGSGRLVLLDEANKRDVLIPGSGGGLTIPGVSEDIRCDKGDRIRFKSDILEFNHMSELLNQRSSVQGKVPSGYLNAIFELSGDWYHDVADTKSLAFDGYFISLYNLHLTASPLVLQDEVKKSVPPRWDPAALSRFIKSYGTHIIVGMAVGGQDLVCVRQKSSSPIPPADLRGHLEDLGDILFSDSRSPSLMQRKTGDGKHKVPEVFSRILQSSTMQLTTISETSSKDGLTIICSKEEGMCSCTVTPVGCKLWLLNLKLFILSLYLLFSLLLASQAVAILVMLSICTYAVNKPALEDLQYFLEFQVPRQWAPMFCELPLRHQRKKPVCASLQFSFFGPKINVSCTQVSTDKKPVVGLRLYLEGKKCNQLALHVQHLSSLPNTMNIALVNSSKSKPCRWRGSDDYECSDQFLEPIRWKKYSNICTSVVKHDPNWLKGESSGVYIVTGAQLISKGSWPKTILHLRLLFTHLPNCSIREDRVKTTTGDQQRQAQAVLNSGVYPDGPPLSSRSAKLRRFVETAEVVRGPHDAPGHWLVTAAKLVKDGGKMVCM
ncbi:hypothetical protein G4B88_011753 [Cannabis sativa]|uniref:MACPF domain-containing protein n=1 Tax=Cannabis sativa TaxID=3483 RepID=A0A7J6GCJ2_CANSA|nr:hypothetical protein G4B88_011753 [Cannabis sativa]